MAKKQGPYKVIEQSEEGRVKLMDLVDTSKVREAHHNIIVIFEGTTEQAQKLARWDRQENLIVEILGYRGSIYAEAFTELRTKWEDDTMSWEPYSVVASTVQFKAYVSNYPRLERLLRTNAEFRDWQEKIWVSRHLNMSTSYQS